jgi:hypothetical protein
MPKRVRRLSASQQRRQDLVEELLQLTIERGVTSKDLRPLVESTCGQQIATGSENSEMWEVIRLHSLARADKISDAGRVAQLYHLYSVWGSYRLRKKLMTLGSQLDGIVKAFSSDPAEVERDIGRENVNSDGDAL